MDDRITNEKQLYHVSWISNARTGSRGDWFRTGGGLSFSVPQNEPQHRIRTAKNTFYIWRCWAPKDPPAGTPYGYSCDPQD